jgi:inner membrane protease subunit 2
MELAKLTFRATLITSAIGVTFWDVCGYISSVAGISMQPIINPKQQTDIVFLNRIPIKFNRIKRGDVVALVSPKNSNEFNLKRVIALPGDIIKTISYKEDYVLIPEGHCWVEGDNQQYSNDSNLYGVVPMGLFVAKATHVIWPLDRISKIKTEIPPNRVLIPLESYENNEEFEDAVKGARKKTINNYFVNFLPFNSD